MVDTVNAWGEDYKGRTLRMYAGARKNYSIDWTDWLGEDTIASALLTLPAAVTQAGSTEIVGSVSTFTLVAGSAGEWACSLKLTTGAGLIEYVLFRVIVQSIA